MEWRDYGTSREIRRLLKISEKEFARPQLELDQEKRRQLGYPDLKRNDEIILALARTKGQQAYLIRACEQAIDLKRAQQYGIDIPDDRLDLKGLETPIADRVLRDPYGEDVCLLTKKGHALLKRELVLHRRGTIEFYAKLVLPVCALIVSLISLAISIRKR